MSNDSLNLENSADQVIRNVELSKPTISSFIRFEGYNEDITESYYWFFSFGYYTGKGYTTLKLEDQHYFSENSQFGTQYRQVKGGSIRAFTENLNQLIQLVKVHLFPLLKEIKQADFYYRWIRNITENDEEVQKFKAQKVSDTDEKLRLARQRRNEAIAHLKDKWVNEVDGGRLWQMQRSSAEQGLDFSLLPQLFFGASIDNPLQGLHGKGISINDQVYKYKHEVDISKDAQDAAARMLFRFYHWLPSAIKDTETTFKIKVTTLKQFYSQIQMYIEFMKPILMEIHRKSEGFGFNSLYKGFEMENPDFVNLLDSSYSYVKTLGIRNYERGSLNFSHLEFSRHGFFVVPTYKKGEKKMIISGPCAGKSGFITGESDGKYEFYKTEDKDISIEDFEKLEKIMIDKNDLAKFSCIQLEFTQTRRNEITEGPQGPQPLPFMKNKINFTGYAWNIFEIAAYRQKLKEKNLELLESFVSELKTVRDDLQYYSTYFEGKKKKTDTENKSKKEEKREEKTEIDNTIFLGPFKGLYDIFKPITSSLYLKKKEKTEESSGLHDSHKIIILNSIEDTHKLYSVYKITHGHL